MPPSGACAARRGGWGEKWWDRPSCGVGALPRPAGRGPRWHTSASLVENTTAPRNSEAAVGDWGEHEEVRKKYREGAEGSRAATLYAAGSRSTSAESEIREVR